MKTMIGIEIDLGRPSTQRGFVDALCVEALEPTNHYECNIVMCSGRVIKCAESATQIQDRIESIGE